MSWVQLYTEPFYPSRNEPTDYVQDQKDVKRIKRKNEMYLEVFQYLPSYGSFAVINDYVRPLQTQEKHDSKEIERCPD